MRSSMNAKIGLTSANIREREDHKTVIFGRAPVWFICAFILERENHRPPSPTALR